jgi:hypothetical protein
MTLTAASICSVCRYRSVRLSCFDDGVNIECNISCCCMLLVGASLCLEGVDGREVQKLEAAGVRLRAERRAVRAALLAFKRN